MKPIEQKNANIRALQELCNKYKLKLQICGKYNENHIKDKYIEMSFSNTLKDNLLLYIKGEGFMQNIYIHYGEEGLKQSLFIPLNKGVERLIRRIKNNEETEQFECPICMDFVDITNTCSDCGNFTCLKCDAKLNRKCPFCREQKKLYMVGYKSELDTEGEIIFINESEIVP